MEIDERIMNLSRLKKLNEGGDIREKNHGFVERKRWRVCYIFLPR